MLAIISPSKTQDFSSCDIKSYSQSRQLKHSQELVSILKNKNQQQISKLMSLSEKLSKLNFDRFQSFKTPFSLGNAKQALLAFKGDVYNGIDASSLSSQDLEFAQNNVRILSGLYGVLRPLDLIQPYRLEMGTKLQNSAGKNLYEFWGDQLSNELVKELNNHKEKTIINCASNEYFKSIDNSGLNAEVVTPVFKEMKNGKSRIISFYAKKARGMMARFIVDNRIDKTDQILDFDLAGYKYDSASSDKNKPIFSRIQP